MSFISILVIALALGMDAFSVAISVGAARSRLNLAAAMRLASSFGLFQFGMPIIGWYAGRTVASLISDYDHWVAFALLTIVGLHMIKESFDKREKTRSSDPTKGWLLLVLSVATSIDALAVGLSFAFLETGILYPSVIIGVVCFVMTAIGTVFGKKIGSLFGKRAEIVGGVVLIAIGVKILIEHML